jgi:hypothetical protein
MFLLAGALLSWEYLYAAIADPAGGDSACALPLLPSPAFSLVPRLAQQALR